VVQLLIVKPFRRTAMNKNDAVATHQELNRVFETGEVFTATAQEHQDYLRRLAAIPINAHMTGDKAQTAYIIRALTINHLQMARTIVGLENTVKKLNAENGRIAFLLVLLTVIATLFGIFGVIWTVCHTP